MNKWFQHLHGLIKANIEADQVVTFQKFSDNAYEIRVVVYLENEKFTAVNVLTKTEFEDPEYCYHAIAECCEKVHAERRRLELKVNP